MKDTDLYSRILGLTEPWFVADVELDTVGGRVDVHVEHAPDVRWSTEQTTKPMTLMMKSLTSPN